MINLKEYFGNIRRGFRIKNFINYFAVIFIIVLTASLSAAGALQRSTLILLEQIAYSVILAVSLSLVVGFLGELSLGHAAFMSLGAFIGGYLQTNAFKGLTAASPLLSIIITMLVGGLVAAVFGFIIGLPALRLKGDYLAIVTLAFGEIVKTVFINLKVFDGAVGLRTYRYDVNTLFIIGFIVVLLTLAVVQNLIRSKHGRAITAIRDNEIAARAMGVNVTFYKLSVFILSAFFAGVAGVLFSNANYSFRAATFDYNYSINILVMVVLGGMGSINGSIIAAALITFINNKLATVLTGDLASLQNLFYALILVALVIYNNAPKLKAFRDKYNFRNLFSFLCGKVRRLFCKKGAKAPDPSVERSDKGDWSNIPTKIEMDAILSTDITPDRTYTPDKPDKPKGGN